jgi:hypothetical protein
MYFDADDDEWVKSLGANYEAFIPVEHLMAQQVVNIAEQASPAYEAALSEGRKAAGLNAGAAKAPEWNGEGLPPVGVVCEFFIGERTRSDAHRHWEDGDKLEVLAHRNACAIVYNKTAGAAAVVNTDCIRPIKSERERAIVAMRSIVDEYAEMNNAMGALYDAGYRKVEK